MNRVMGYLSQPGWLKWSKEASSAGEAGLPEPAEEVN
jgi:hypothetical protein